MATKKKKAAPKAKPKPKARPQARPHPGVSAAPMPVLAPPAESSNQFFGLVLIVAILGLSWLAIKNYQAKQAGSGVVMAPPSVPAVSTPTMPQGVTPPARSIAPAPVATAVVPKPKATAHREAAGSGEVGAPSLTFDRSAGKSIRVHCWRATDGVAQLDVFGPRNRIVHSVKSAAGAQGWVDLEWDGKDTAGRKVPEGLYFLRPSAKEEQSIRDVWVKG